MILAACRGSWCPYLFGAQYVRIYVGLNLVRKGSCDFSLAGNTDTVSSYGRYDSVLDVQGRQGKSQAAQFLTVYVGLANDLPAQSIDLLSPNRAV